jgi:hypothetical protein
MRHEDLAMASLPAPVNSMNNHSSKAPVSFEIPFSADVELHHDDLFAQDPKAARNHLAGQPSILHDDDQVPAYIKNELVTPKLNKMAPHLWLLATPSSTHVSPLHEQIVRGRQVVISENPELHLVWIGSRVFIKPLPIYLLSRTFWEYYLHASKATPEQEQRRVQLAQAALGYMRSYHHLIRHESDFHIAVNMHLVPPNVTHLQFMVFISGFRKISDDEVSPRYRFGELRMTRLNAWARLLLGEPYFHKVAWQYADVFARYYAPYLFVFSVVSVILSAMQVGVGARTEWSSFQGVSAWFSVLTLVFVVLVSLILILDFLLMALREVMYAFSRRFVQKSTKPDT